MTSPADRDGLAAALALVKEALDIPHGATAEDQAIRNEILTDRAVHAVMALTMIFELGVDVPEAIAYLREQLADCPPAGYKTWPDLMDELRAADSGEAGQ
jgi:hypothetical protein